MSSLNHTPTAHRSGRNTPAINAPGYATPSLATPAEETAPATPSPVVAQEAAVAGSDSETPINHIQQTNTRDSGKTRVSRHGILNSSKASNRFSYDGEPLHYSGSVKSHRPRFRDEWDDEYADAQTMRDYEKYWRDDNGRYTRFPPRRGPWSRPPPAILNGRPSMTMNNEELEDLMKGFDDNRSVRDPFDAPRRRRTDEEMGMGYQEDGPLYRMPAHSYTGSFNGRQLDWKSMSAMEKAEVLRLPLTQWMNSSLKNHFVATLGEFIGTTLFLFFAFAGTEVANIKSTANSETTTGGATGFNIGTLLYISIIFGFSLMVNVWIFFRISGGLFNPAVTMAMVLVKAITVARGFCLLAAQILGSMLASVVVRYLFPESFNVRTSLGGGASLVQGVFIEAILTAELVFTIFMLAKEKHRATFMAPIGIGLALFIAEMVGVQFTGGSLNPARSFGPCAVTATFEPEHWIYWVGPLSGSLLAVVFYRFIKTLEYEMANPGADGDDFNDPTKNPEKRAEIRMSKTASVVN